MAKPLLLNGKPIELKPVPQAVLRLKQFLDKQWMVYTQVDLAEEADSSKDSINRFQREFPHYVLARGYKGFRPIYGSPKALAEYERIVKKPAVKA